MVDLPSSSAPVIIPALAQYLKFTPNEKFVTNLYHDLYHNYPPLQTITTLGTQLDQGTISPLAVARQFTFSQSYGMTVVQDLYQSMLHRDYNPAMDQGTVNWYLTALSVEISNPASAWPPDYAASRDQLAAAIAASQEYHNTRGGGTTTGWFTALYMDALHRAPTQAELNSYTSGNHFLNQMDYDFNVAVSVFSSTEHKQVEVSDFYQHFLHRLPEPAGLTFWVNRLQSGIPIEEVIAEIASSPEYLRLAQS
jgi:hypothetical protein